VETKAVLRREAQARRLGRAPAVLDDVLAELLVGARRVAAYLPVGTEPRLTVRPGWLLPVVTEDWDLDWSEYDGRLATRRGLQEPTGPLLGREALASCDLVIVPALLVARDGSRLGKGGGCYDRALPRTKALTVALIHEHELVDQLPSEPHDIRVGAVATPASGVTRLPEKM
jgi:5-formyltetrahydrofolate cyclo-ligase